MRNRSFDVGSDAIPTSVELGHPSRQQCSQYETKDGAFFSTLISDGLLYSTSICWSVQCLPICLHISMNTSNSILTANLKEGFILDLSSQCPHLNRCIVVIIDLPE